MDVIIQKSEYPVSRPKGVNPFIYGYVKLLSGEPRVCLSPQSNQVVEV